MATLRYTDSAENDLIEAWVYISEDNLQVADKLVETIDQEARNLLVHAQMGRERPELGHGLRSWPTSTPYVLFYFVDDAGVVVARILHHARDVGGVADWPHE